MALDFRNTKESNNKENNELKEVFNWFSNNEHFLNDVKDILNEQSKGANALKQLEEQYKTRLETTSYKKHFNSLLTIIHFLSETGKPEVIDNLLQVVNTKNEVRKHHEEVERETKGRILVTKIAQAGEKEIALKSEESRLEKLNAQLDIDIANKNVDIKIQKYWEAVKQFDKTLDSINKHRDENTGTVNVVFDSVIDMFGGRSGKDIYKESFENTKKSLEDLVNKIKELSQNPNLTPEQRTKLNTILEIASKTKSKSMYLGVGKTVGNSAEAIPESLELAAHGIKGEIAGVVSVINGIIDLTKFIYNYTKSTFGDNPEYRDKINQQAGKIWEFIKKEGMQGMGDVISKALAEELDKIARLPKKQQAEAIGDLAGKVIGTLLLMKGGINASKYGASQVSKINRIGKLESKLTAIFEKGLSEGADATTKSAHLIARSEKLAELLTQAKNGKYLSELLSAGFNGPFEFALGRIVSNAFKLRFLALQSKGAGEDAYRELANGITKAVKEGKDLPTNELGLDEIPDEGAVVGKSSEIENGRSFHTESDPTILEVFINPINIKEIKDILNKVLSGDLDLTALEIAKINPFIGGKLDYIEKNWNMFFHVLPEGTKSKLLDLITQETKTLDELTKELETIANSYPNLVNKIGPNNSKIVNTQAINGNPSDAPKSTDNHNPKNNPEQKNDDIGEIGLDVYIDKKKMVFDALQKGGDDKLNDLLILAEMSYPDIINKLKHLKDNWNINFSELTADSQNKLVSIITDENIKMHIFPSKIEEFARKNGPKINKITNININGPLKLEDLSLKSLEGLTSKPRTIDIGDGELISIAKTSTTKDGGIVYTIRYGIKQNNTPYPQYQRISTFTVNGNNVHIMDVSPEFIDTRTRLFQHLNSVDDSFENISQTSQLKEFKRGVISRTANAVKKQDSTIFDAGINDKGQRVLLVTLKDAEGKPAGQFELNLFEEDGKNIIYFGSLSKNNLTVDIFRDYFPGLLPRLSDILNVYSDRKLPYFLRYDRTAQDGRLKPVRNIPIQDAINNFIKNSDSKVLKAMTQGILKMFSS